MTKNSFNIAHFLASRFIDSKLVVALIPAILLFGLMGLLLTHE